jgi:membrane protein implicated in regulation of membrane protease activity
MYLVGIGWLYVAFMMALVEATSPQGSVLGAAFTFLMYGVVPVSLLLYILGTPARKRRLREAQRASEADPEKMP